jgi:ABC-type glycerol-3-phosphate transport system permease component
MLFTPLCQPDDRSLDGSPSAVTPILVFLLLCNLNFLESPNALIWSAGAGVGGIFLLRQHFQSVPKELEEAAVMGRANRLRVYWQICLPLVKGMLSRWRSSRFWGCGTTCSGR